MLGMKPAQARACSHPRAWFTVICWLWLAGTSPAEIILHDSFEYVADRDANNVEVAFRAHGWTDVKAENSYYGRGAGYLYTQYDPVRKSRVLVMESLPSMSQHGQTDYWLKYGGGDYPIGAIPANVWFQFWTYATPESRWHRQKFLYPCRGSYPCTSGSFLWLMGFDHIDLTGEGDGYIEAPPGGRFFRVFADHANYYGGNSWNRQKLYQNLSHTPLLAAEWYQVRIHIDTSGPQGVYELWIRKRREARWTKLAEWIGDVTPNFTWPVPADLRDGNRQMAIPTTVNTYDSTTYMDDFIMATSVHDLERAFTALPPQESNPGDFLAEP